MAIQQIVKNSIISNKEKIELIQSSIISGISSLFYSQYIRRFKYKMFPTKSVMIPSIKLLKDYFKQDSLFMNYLSGYLIERISIHPLILKYSDKPELSMFDKYNIEMMKTIFDVYIIPNISKYIPDAFSKKFGLENDNQQVFIENWEISIFDNPINDKQYDFIIDQIVIQLLVSIPSIKKEIEFPEDRIDITMDNDKIFSITNEKGICPIYFNDKIINNEEIINLLEFVTNTHFSKNEDGKYNISTGSFNYIALIKFLDI